MAGDMSPAGCSPRLQLAGNAAAEEATATREELQTMLERAMDEAEDARRKFLSARREIAMLRPLVHHSRKALAARAEHDAELALAELRGLAHRMQDSECHGSKLQVEGAEVYKLAATLKLRLDAAEDDVTLLQRKEKILSERIVHLDRVAESLRTDVSAREKAIGVLQRRVARLEDKVAEEREAAKLRLAEVEAEHAQELAAVRGSAEQTAQQAQRAADAHQAALGGAHEAAVQALRAEWAREAARLREEGERDAQRARAEAAALQASLSEATRREGVLREQLGALEERLRDREGLCESLRGAARDHKDVADQKIKEQLELYHEKGQLAEQRLMERVRDLEDRLAYERRLRREAEELRRQPGARDGACGATERAAEPPAPKHGAQGAGAGAARGRGRVEVSADSGELSLESGSDGEEETAPRRAQRGRTAQKGRAGKAKDAGGGARAAPRAAAEGGGEGARKGAARVDISKPYSPPKVADLEDSDSDGEAGGADVAPPKKGARKPRGTATAPKKARAATKRAEAAQVDPRAATWGGDEPAEAQRRRAAAAAVDDTAQAPLVPPAAQPRAAAEAGVRERAGAAPASDAREGEDTPSKTKTPPPKEKKRKGLSEGGGAANAAGGEAAHAKKRKLGKANSVRASDVGLPGKAAPPANTAAASLFAGGFAIPKLARR
ncbi:unnamed protein product [Pedinophyceae sp. YPF-701]|nr:unnamed protein product [Pedinophyceae sp. YPF-701]